MIRKFNTIQQFLDYQDYCPFCQFKLKTEVECFNAEVARPQHDFQDNLITLKNRFYGGEGDYKITINTLTNQINSALIYNLPPDKLLIHRFLHPSKKKDERIHKFHNEFSFIKHCVNPICYEIMGNIFSYTTDRVLISNKNRLSGPIIKRVRFSAKINDNLSLELNSNYKDNITHFYKVIKDKNQDLNFTWNTNYLLNKQYSEAQKIDFIDLLEESKEDVVNKMLIYLAFE